MDLTEARVLEILRPVKDPELNRSMVELGMIKDVRVLSGSAVSLQIELTTPACPLKGPIEASVRDALKAAGVALETLTWGAQVRASPGAKGPMLQQVKNVILVGSGKGGVGKSTVAVNLAVALAKTGAKVGLLDADIYGPSIPLMMGLYGRKPSSPDGKSIFPLSAYGCEVMSIGFFVDPDQAMIWRGPMLHGALVQFFRDVRWGELDYLVLDLPPGTGDIQLTISQQLKVAGAVIVTTPQDVALADAIKAKMMFDKVDIPVLGLVENMSYFACPHCHEKTEIFSRGGGAKAADKLGIPFLGEVPLHADVRIGGDEGRPIVVTHPESDEALQLTRIAHVIADRISVTNIEGRAAGEKFALPIAAVRS